MRRVHVLRTGAAALAVVTATACGSTVQVGPGGAVVAPQAGQSGGLSVPTTGTQPGSALSAPPAGSAPGALSGPAATSGTTSGSTLSSGRTAGSRTTSRTGVVAQAPGVTATTVTMGIGYSSQSAAGDRAIGAAGAAPSYDTRDVFNAAIKYANEHGGFAGRKLQPIYYDYNLTDPADQQDQSACDYWTHDHKVFAVAPAGKGDVLRACMEKAGGVSIYCGAGTKQTFQRF